MSRYKWQTPPVGRQPVQLIGLPQVWVIDPIDPEQVCDFHSKVTEVVLSGQLLEAPRARRRLQTHLLHADAQLSTAALCLRTQTLSCSGTWPLFHASLGRKQPLYLKGRARLLPGRRGWTNKESRRWEKASNLPKREEKTPKLPVILSVAGCALRSDGACPVDRAFVQTRGQVLQLKLLK